MSTSITSSDCSKPLKITFPSPVNVSFGYNNYHRLEIKFGKECINFKGDQTKPSVSIPVKNGELKVKNGGFMQVPVLYFEY